jgi:hypothetical protein
MRIVVHSLSCSAHPGLIPLSSYSISLPFLHFLQRLHCAMQSMPVIPSKLRIGAFKRGVSMSFRLLDTEEERMISEVIPMQMSIAGRGRY